MKKIFYSILVIMLAFVLVSCDDKDEPVVFSKIFTAQRMANNVIELYNNSDKDINLSKYKIDIYNDGSTEVTNTIELEGVIEANNYYVIGGPSFDSTTFADVTDKFDLIYDKSLPFNGDDALAIVKGKKIVDFIGYIEGIGVKFSEGVALFRLGNKEDFVGYKEFYQFNYIQYLPHSFEFLKNDNHKIQTLEDLYKGPSLHDFYKDLDYANDSMGTGGAVLATLVGVADGDTATFNFPEKPAGTSSHRYYYIDTAETGGPNTNDEPWGHIGSMYNKQFLLDDEKNKTIHVQSIPLQGIHDTYNRNLGLIWVEGHLSQFHIVSEGLSTVDAVFDETDLELYWENVPYLTFLLFAQERAKQNGWGLHGYPNNPDGERAPDWNYAADKKAPDANYQNWKPHLDLPY